MLSLITTRGAIVTCAMALAFRIVTLRRRSWARRRGRRFRGRIVSGKIAFMVEFEIVIAPAGAHRQADVFTAHWGDILLATSRTPFFDSARKLLELGADPNDLLVMRHGDSAATSLRARIAAAAKHTVTETNAGPRYITWRDLSEIWHSDPASEVAC